MNKSWPASIKQAPIPAFSEFPDLLTTDTGDPELCLQRIVLL